MRIISRKTLRDFYENPEYKDPKTPLETWFHETIKAEWNSPAEIKGKYRNTSIIGNNRIVFNIHGNKYRLIIKVHYNLKIVYIRFIGTHKQYDEINAEEI